MADVRDIVTDALRELGVIAAGETATADDALYGLASVNRLVDQWKAERLTIYTVARTEYALVSGTQDYTVGAAGNFNVQPWPVYMDHVSYEDSTTSPVEELPLERFSEEQWALLTPKAMTANEPSAWYYNPAFPLGTLSFWPVPTSATLTGVIYAPQAVGEFTSLSEAVSLPPGYRRMLVKNLALELAPSYERSAQRELIAAAVESKSVVKRSNWRLRELSFEPAALLGTRRSTYNISTDR